jgi:hypothetical protein
VSDAEYQKHVEGVVSQLTDAERAVGTVLKEMAAAASKEAATPGSPGRKGGAGTPTGGVAQFEDVPGDAGFLADEVAGLIARRPEQWHVFSDAFARGGEG